MKHAKKKIAQANQRKNPYYGVNFRLHPNKYKIGPGEQGVLTAEPYKTEILPFWRFKTPKEAKISARKIFSMFQSYLKQKDFVGADMARKFLQMGWTRARRYANHPSGGKYTAEGKLRPQAKDAMSSAKAESAAIFFAVYSKAKTNKRYLALRAAFLGTAKK